MKRIKVDDMKVKESEDHGGQKHILPLEDQMKPERKGRKRAHDYFEGSD